ncbi:hypothetical protein SPLC1_S520310 [Arthrospira platensis C1]|nr:hypothetical protein SPLC1_S520310 [Arthrospira platensis C1]
MLSFVAENFFAGGCLSFWSASGILLDNGNSDNFVICG